MASAVIFDFYGTLAHWHDRDNANYQSAFARHGYEAPDDVLTAYFSRYDGVEHSEHSVSEATYEAWVRSRLHELTRECGVAESDRETLVTALRAMDQSPMVAYPEAAETLRTLRDGGWTIAVCSNWGWELDAYLREVGLWAFVQSAVTSARAGARKPHPSIFTHTVEVLGIDPGDAVFVGDSWEPDVEGPRRAGMTAVHVWRPEEQPGVYPPELPEGAHRVADLTGLLPLLNLVSR
ncbi:MAG TPA: HAD family hydrolase [Acidimicrobiales bacterium]|nr:HAD family hydrolase [Acidimicrobiales bacterium]